MNTSRSVIMRSFPVEMSEGDGRTIVGRCVPYGEVATVDDGQGPFKESFAKGAFRRATTSAQRVILDFEHREGILDVVGHAVELAERDDGLHGTFSAVGAPGDQALELIRAGVLGGMSVRALVMGPGRRDGDVVVRTACHLDRVALCREPAYAGAVVEALRSRGDDRLMMPPKLAALRPVRDVALDDALRDLGIV